MLQEMERLMTAIKAHKLLSEGTNGSKSGTDGTAGSAATDNISVDGGADGQTRDDDREENREKVERFVAQIKTESADGFDVDAPWHRNPDTYSSSGTAWFVRPPQQDAEEPTSYLITCAHCVGDAVKDGVTITVPAYRKYAARENKRATINVDVVAVFPEVDAALLHIYDFPSLFKKEGGENSSPPLQFHAYELGDDTTLRNTDKLVIYGHPLGTESVKTVTVQYNGREDFNIQMDGAINEGHSGSAILDQDQRVIGHVTSGVTFANNVSYGTPIGLLKPLLAAVELPRANERVAKTQIVRQGDVGVAFYKSYLQMKDYLETDCRGGILVEYVMSTSPLREKINRNDLFCRIRLSPSSNSMVDEEEEEAGAGDDEKRGKKGSRRFRWYDITNEGKVEVDWEGSTDVITLRELVQRWPHKAAIDMQFFDAKDRKTKTIERQSLDYMPQNGIKALHFPWETPDYEVVAGIVVMPLSRKLRRQAPFIKPENLDQPAVVVTKVLKPSDVHQQNVDITGKLERVNGQKVATMEDFRRAFRTPELRENSSQKYLTFQNEMGHLVVMPVSAFLEKEPDLAKNKRYPLSKLYHDLNTK